MCIGSVCIVKTAALNLPPPGAFSRPRSQFFVARSSLPANNIFIFQVSSGNYILMLFALDFLSTLKASVRDNGIVLK